MSNPNISPPILGNVDPSMVEQFDTIIIGAGQSGDPLARALAKFGQIVALIERDAVGGTCINYGCTPTKTMVASASVAALAKRASEYGIEINSLRVNMASVRDRKRELVESWRSSTESRLMEIGGLSLVYGEAKFIDANTVTVALNVGGNRTLTAKTVVINAGERPRIPAIPGLKGVSYLDSTSIMELDAVPEHLVILGGGYVACEFAQMFRRFGSEVTVLQRGAQLLDREDPDIASAIKDILTEDGIKIHLNAEVNAVEPTSTGVRVTGVIAGAALLIEGSQLLVAVGRTPNTERLNLAAAGIEVNEHGYIKVNDRLETNVPNVYAIGDIKGGPAFTHISYDDFRVLKRRLIDGDSDASIAGRLIPYAVFIDPQLGRVGLSETDAKRMGKRIRVAKLPMTSVARAAERGETRGLMKAIVDAESPEILGCAILGMEGGEIMAMFEIAMMGSVPYTALKDGIFAHPTLAEALNNLFATLSEP